MYIFWSRGAKNLKGEAKFEVSEYVLPKVDILGIIVIIWYSLYELYIYAICNPCINMQCNVHFHFHQFEVEIQAPVAVLKSDKQVWDIYVIHVWEVISPMHNVHFGYYDGPVVKSWNPKIHFLMGKKYFWGYFSYVVLGRKL